MADITLVAPIRLASDHGLATITGTAGEAITAGAACYVKSDGLIWLSVAIAAGVGAQFDGICLTDAVAGETVTIFQQGYKIRIGAHGLAIGAFLFASVTPGAMADATAGSLPEEPIAKAITATEVEITRMDRPNIDNT